MVGGNLGRKSGTRDEDDTQEGHSECEKRGQPMYVPRCFFKIVKSEENTTRACPKVSVPVNLLTFAIAYVGLVGIPGVLVAVVLKYGTKLTVPACVAGTWTITSQSDAQVPSDCISFTPQQVVISQSGRHLMLVSNDPSEAGPRRTAEGLIAGHTLTASFGIQNASKGPFCSGSHFLSLTATLDIALPKTSLVGYLSVDNCLACGTLKVTAVRQKSSDSVGY
jgi:hypothetical protein